MAPDANLGTPRRFMYEDMWARHESYEAMVTSAWNNAASGEQGAMRMGEKLQVMTAEMQHWGRTVFGSVRRQIKKLKLDLEDAKQRALVSGTSLEVRDFEGQLQELYEREEIMYKQRSRVGWLREGDQNTRHRKRKKPLCAVKLDMMKAYDRVEWTFLEQVMQKFGFDQVWVNMIMSIVFLEGSHDNLETLRDILQCYEQASGQRVNLQKSSIFFGKGRAENNKAMLKGIIGITSEALSEKYLGLPTVVGRSKDGTFKPVRESARGKVLGWKGQGLSKAAKEILAKSGLQATPTFTVSCFQLSKKMCRNLTTISSNFWWGSTHGENKVHWVAWDKMCLPKRDGGMGFRNFEAFNQALLAKQAWRLMQEPDSLVARLLQEPDSLVARLLRARYYKDSSIMQATCPSNGSYTFRSILFGRDLLKEGLVWRVGDGADILIHHDNWIPRKGSMRPLGHIFMHGITRVADLLSEGGDGWNHATVDAMFSADDAEDIKQILMGGHGAHDLLAWNFTKSGEFNVRSAYHLAMSLRRAKAGRPEGEAQEEQKEMFFQGAYGLWLARNATRDGVRIQDATEVAASVSRFMDEWSNAVPKKLRSSSAPPVDKWCPPEQGWTKANVDGAVGRSSGDGGGGLVGRELHFQRLHVEMDSKEAVCMINDARRNLLMVGTIVEDIKSLMRC
ncbi:uncharacterized protein [Aegilops tauschii subsp. strangulata]|uniref:uncharacterized protein n=1 Tax=Aegilops tauschii subsp. strangulata TaxID=200361 RepID=UPI003CC8BD90